jgi:DNA repair ATPase RecN
MNSAPWTEIGSLQHEVREIRNQLHQKANSYEISEIDRRLDSMEHTCRSLRSEIDGILSRLQEIQENSAHILYQVNK